MSKYDIKQLIILREDLKISLDQIARFSADASVDALLSSIEMYEESFIDLWRSQDNKKVVLRAKNLEQFIEWREYAEKDGLVTSVISGYSLSELKSVPVLMAIGPVDLNKTDYFKTIILMRNLNEEFE